MHQVAISTADKFNGADLGIRQEWLPLFDKYGVDLVVCGHEHHYERSHPIRGQQANGTLTPIPVATDTTIIDTTQGTVHMVIGGGGTSMPSNQLFFNPPCCRVVMRVGERDSPNRQAPTADLCEGGQRLWSAVRNAAHAYGFSPRSTLDHQPSSGRHDHDPSDLLRRGRPGWADLPVRKLHFAPSPTRWASLVFLVIDIQLFLNGEDSHYWTAIPDCPMKRQFCKWRGCRRGGADPREFAGFSSSPQGCGTGGLLEAGGEVDVGAVDTVEGDWW